MDGLRFTSADSAVLEVTLRLKNEAGEDIASSWRNTLLVREGGQWKVAITQEWDRDDAGDVSLTELAWLVGTWEGMDGFRLSLHPNGTFSTARKVRWMGGSWSGYRLSLEDTYAGTWRVRDGLLVFRSGNYAEAYRLPTPDADFTNVAFEVLTGTAKPTTPVSRQLLRAFRMWDETSGTAWSYRKVSASVQK